MTRHEQLQEQIPAFVADRLDGTESGQVQEHLSDCEDCTDLVRVGNELVQGLRDGKEEIFTAHPDARMLRRYSLGEEVDGRGELVRHVASCASCELEVSAWRRWGKVKPTSTQEEEFRAAQGRSINWKSALAAGILLGMGLMFGLRDIGPQPAQAPTPWTGSAALLTLEAAYRSAAPVAQIFIEPHQPYLPLVVSPELPPMTPAGEHFRFAIATAGAADPLWSLELSAEAVQTQQEATGVVTFLVPATGMDAGHYTFSMHKAGDEPILQIPFEVQRQSPVATNPPQ
jgi:hypothetical protein